METEFRSLEVEWEIAEMKFKVSFFDYYQGRLKAGPGFAVWPAVRRAECFEVFYLFIKITYSAGEQCTEMSLQPSGNFVRLDLEQTY